MRIRCPYCGERDVGEFTYRGDATLVRPDPAAAKAGAAFFDYVYVRDNPAGLHDEHWYHGGGCRAWLVVQRDTRTHEIFSVALARREEAMPADAPTGGAPHSEAP
jgi:methylglutamate dehydrogenase subunit B